MNIVVPPEAPTFFVELTRAADGKIAPVRSDVVVLTTLRESFTP
jgi:hypothetical protein